MANELVSVNSQIAPVVSDIHNMQYMRVTSLRDFDECPDRWRVKYLEGIVQGGSNAADIGTAIHSLVEMQLKGTFNPEYEADEYQFMSHFKIIPKSEQAKVLEYLQGLEAFASMELLALEHEFEFKFSEDMPPIRGHIDAVFRDADMNIYIVDHKTNRSSNDETWWSMQLQPQIYSYAARRLWECRSVTFHIGYVMLGYNIEWPVTEQDDARLERRIGELWKKMVEYSYKYAEERIEFPGAHWPRRVTEGCRWCPIKNNCIDYTNSLTNFAKSFEDKRRQATLTEQLEFVDAVEKLAAAEKAALQAVIKEKVKNSPTGDFVDGDTTWQIAFREQRSIQASHMLGVLGALLNEKKLSVDIYKEFLDVIFSVKVTGADKLTKAQPILKDVFADITQRVSVGDGTLKPIKNNKLMGGIKQIGTTDGEHA